ncbi:MAG: metallophosphoesterase [Bacteroidetes bacterium]|nr:metallophosphoesterase [Bacteroidota bacterium]
MKASAFLIFFSIVLVIYGLVNSYIFIRGLQAIPAGSCWRPWYIASFWIIASTFVLARILERTYPCGFTGIITWIGSFWLAFMLYFILIAVFVDFARVINHFFHIFPQLFYVDYQKTKLVVLFGSLLLVALVVAGGFINARIPRITKLDLHVKKKAAGEKTLNIVMASDIHLGTIIAKRKANRLVATINGLHPDIVLFAGDVVDEDLAPVIKNDLGANLGMIKAKLGVYAITGNHEYIGGAEAAVKYLREHGVNVLRDTAILIDQRFYLVGRDDRDKSRFTGKPRKELAELMHQVDLSYPVILMDHQPFHLEQAVKQGVDLQLSGHTHHGQLWPFNYITTAMYEISHGYKLTGNTNFYVSTGFGTWGPPVRLGNRPEIVQIRLTFD